MWSTLKQLGNFSVVIQFTFRDLSFPSGNCRTSNSLRPQLCTCTLLEKMRSRFTLHFFVAHFGPMNDGCSNFSDLFWGWRVHSYGKITGEPGSNILETLRKKQIKGGQNCPNQMQLGYSGVFLILKKIIVHLCLRQMFLQRNNSSP